MPVSQPALLKPQQGLSIYRQLLRECSYLPPAVRPSLQSTIQTRFRQHRKYDPRAKEHWRRAQKTLRTLRAANNGHPKCMDSLIAKAFGRTGVRRRQLMSEFVVPQGVHNSKMLDALTSGASDQTARADNHHSTKDTASMPIETGKRPAGNRKNLFFQKWDQEKLLKLLSSQRKRQTEAWSTGHLLGSAVKSVNPNIDIPAKNIWGEPPAECVANAKRARWWRRGAAKMLPPLGKGEWELLSRLSRGAQESGEWQMPERRIAAGGSGSRAGTKRASRGAELAAAASELMRYISQSAAAVEKKYSAKRMLRSAQTDAGPYGFSQSGNSLSARWYRRAYNKAWLLTPKMEQDPNTLRYKFTWGELPGHQLRNATRKQRSIFDGVDAKGKPLPKPTAD